MNKTVPSFTYAVILICGMVIGSFIQADNHDKALSNSNDAFSASSQSEVDTYTYSVIQEIRNISGGYRQSIVLLTGVRLGIFSALSKKSLTSDQLADILKADKRATELVLNTLVSINLLKKKNNMYTNTPNAEHHLVKEREYYLGDILSHEFSLIGRWLTLPDVVKKGHPVPAQYTDAGANPLRDFILGMANIAQTSARQTVQLLDLSGIHTMLDLGGGPGTYSIVFCQRYPKLKAVVFDRPNVIEIAKEQIAGAGLTERITTLAGDFFVDDIGKEYDLVFISNIIHSLGKDAMIQLLKKSYQALKPGGKIVVKDFILNEDMTSPKNAALFSINMLTATQDGRCYAYSEIKELFEDIGFAESAFLSVNEEDALAIAGRKNR